MIHHSWLTLLLRHFSMTSQFQLNPRLSEMILIKDLAAKEHAPQCQYLWCSSFLKATKMHLLLWHPIYQRTFPGNHPFITSVWLLFSVWWVYASCETWNYGLGELQGHDQFQFTQLCLSIWLSRQNLSQLSLCLLYSLPVSWSKF